MQSLNKKKTSTVINSSTSFKNNIQRFKKVFIRDYQLLLLCLPAIIYFFIFHYLPMYGIQIAFKDYITVKGIWGSPWVGLKHFERFFSSFQFWDLIKNTLGISFYQLVVGFPIPIILAILLNQLNNKRFKKLTQTVTYLPHFISIVVLAGMLYIFLSPINGIINQIIIHFGGQPIFFLGEAKWFKSIFVFSGIWQNTGWNAIIYIAALAGISSDLYEAAKIDGANKWQIVKYIDLPSIMPTAVMLLILEVGKVMNLGFQKAYLLQNPLNISSSEIISTYVYKVGLVESQYSYSAAIGLFNSVINVILLVTVNKLAKKITNSSLW